MRCGSKPSTMEPSADDFSRLLTRSELKEELQVQLSGLQKELLEEVQKVCSEIRSSRGSTCTITREQLEQPEQPVKQMMKTARTLPCPAPQKTLHRQAEMDEEVDAVVNQAKKGLRRQLVGKVQTEMASPTHASSSRHSSRSRSREETMNNGGDMSGKGSHVQLLPGRPSRELMPVEENSDEAEDLLAATQTLLCARGH
eukprot:gb/GFBE01065478.1/.p1 GENE.gb/GFBE01065478.1/~~gb/GFBE01065478.1/.p1  ORF type:complete len:199 (+),score=50.07 gb/GFBE01065478.1/:1-597(+)